MAKRRNKRKRQQAKQQQKRQQNNNKNQQMSSARGNDEPAINDDSDHSTPVGERPVLDLPTIEIPAGMRTSVHAPPASQSKSPQPSGPTAQTKKSGASQPTAKNNAPKANKAPAKQQQALVHAKKPKATPQPKVVPEPKADAKTELNVDKPFLFEADRKRAEKMKKKQEEERARQLVEAGAYCAPDNDDEAAKKHGLLTAAEVAEQRARDSVDVTGGMSADEAEYVAKVDAKVSKGTTKPKGSKKKHEIVLVDSSVPTADGIPDQDEVPIVDHAGRPDEWDRDTMFKTPPGASHLDQLIPAGDIPYTIPSPEEDDELAREYLEHRFKQRGYKDEEIASILARQHPEEAPSGEHTDLEEHLAEVFDPENGDPRRDKSIHERELDRKVVYEDENKVRKTTDIRSILQSQFAKNAFAAYLRRLSRKPTDREIVEQFILLRAGYYHDQYKKAIRAAGTRKVEVTITNPETGMMLGRSVIETTLDEHKLVLEGKLPSHLEDRLEIFDLISIPSEKTVKDVSAPWSDEEDPPSSNTFPADADEIREATSSGGESEIIIADDGTEEEWTKDDEVILWSDTLPEIHIDKNGAKWLLLNGDSDTPAFEQIEGDVEDYAPYVLVDKEKRSWVVSYDSKGVRSKLRLEKEEPSQDIDAAEAYEEEIVSEEEEIPSHTVPAEEADWVDDLSLPGDKTPAPAKEPETISQTVQKHSNGNGNNSGGRRNKNRNRKRNRNKQRAKR